MSGDLGAKTAAAVARLGLQPAPGRGQHLIVDEQVVEDVVAAAKLQPGQLVVEVGPGLGTLTQALLRAGVSVLALELDERFRRPLEELAHRSGGRLRLAWGDAVKLGDAQLAAELAQLPGAAGPRPSYRIVANLPYRISAAFFRRFLGGTYRPRAVTVLVQAEVAERACAAAGQLSLLGLGVQLYGQPQIVRYVEPGAFLPPPEVRSAIVTVAAHRRRPVGAALEPTVWRLARIGFAGKRKQLKNTLASGLHVTPAEVVPWLVEVGVPPEARPQELTVEDWVRLATLIALGSQLVTGS